MQVAGHALRLSVKAVVDGVCEFDLVLALLLLLPCLLSVTLLLRNPFVLFLQGFELGGFFIARLILKHASHSSDNSGLLGVRSLLLNFSLNTVVVLLGLLLNPGFLLCSLEGKALVVEQVLALKLAATRCKSGHILLGAVESLSCSFHIFFK